MKILIVGATGVEGSLTTKKLLAQGIAVRVLTRTPAKAAALAQLGAEVVQGDLREVESLRRACAGVDKVLAAAHSLLGRGVDASKYVDAIGHKQLIDVAKAAGVQHLVYTSILGGSPTYPVPFNQIKLAVEHYLQASGLAYTILRPSAFMEWHAHEFIGKPILDQGKVTIFGKGDNPRNFVAGEDVANFAVLALTDPKASTANHRDRQPGQLEQQPGGGALCPTSRATSAHHPCTAGCVTGHVTAAQTLPPRVKSGDGLEHPHRHGRHDL